MIGRATGELYQLHVEEWNVDALIDGEVLFMVGGRTGTLRAVGPIDGEKRPCPSLTGATGLRPWSAPGARPERGLVAAHLTACSAPDS